MFFCGGVPQEGVGGVSFKGRVYIVLQKCQVVLFEVFIYIESTCYCKSRYLPTVALLIKYFQNFTFLLKQPLQ